MATNQNVAVFITWIIIIIIPHKCKCLFVISNKIQIQKKFCSKFNYLFNLNNLFILKLVRIIFIFLAFFEIYK